MIPVRESTTQPAPDGALEQRAKLAGIALLEVLVSVLVLGIGVGATMWSLTFANQLAEVNRCRNAALALCQERIEQVFAAPFSPPATLPTYFGTTWPVPASDTVTSTETVQLFTSPSGSSVVPGTRTTLVSLGNATLKLVRVTVRVNYNYRGNSFISEIYSLRAPD
jgi:type II secretory pathway pseudopilin PulG